MCIWCLTCIYTMGGRVIEQVPVWLALFENYGLLRLKQTSSGRDILHVSLKLAAREKSTSCVTLANKGLLGSLSTWPLYWWISFSCCPWTVSSAIINLNCEYNFILSFRSFPSQPLDYWVVMRPSKQDHWVGGKLRVWWGGKRNEFNFLVQCLDHLHYLHKNSMGFEQQICFLPF